MNNVTKWKIMADPVIVSNHPYHANRYVATDDTILIVVNGLDGEPKMLCDSGRIVCDMRDGVNQHTDAKLIASAPEMLAALEHCARVFRAWVHDSNPDGYLKPGESMGLDASILMRDKVQMAINKAKGVQ